ncbi:hypothetical protein EXIGLDRAFT_752196 [Exidia glandulosa HHB12029]|uniref:Protein kinase domain-containing protein n=1 Tax=Exidia glandulosa HHB12029 TaxID=1314781 RepID=A0A165ER86_EXIGL|nr:hypothetical protein EXIGLDRAFT_752196 [Exidia glandulosa HHB12029]
MPRPLKHPKPDFALQPSEHWWSDHYDEFLARGYRLRERYNRKVMDAWLVHSEFDDYEARGRGLLDIPDDDRTASVGMDAVRTSRNDGLVWIKLLRLEESVDSLENLRVEDVREGLINNVFVAHPDPFDHCVPLADIFLAHDKPLAELTASDVKFTCVCLVYPWGMLVDRHPWRMAAEAISFVQQLLEGLVYLHRLNIAHRDIHPRNIVMSLVPIFLDVDPVRNLRMQLDDAPYRDRIEVPATYWYIDFGLSTHFSDDNHIVEWEAGVLLLPEVFGMDSPPRGSKPTRTPYDALAGDVWQLGSTFKFFFENSIPSLCPLLDAMTQSDPSKRPTAEQCLADFHARTDRLSRWQLLRPVRDAHYILRQPVSGKVRRLCFLMRWKEYFRLLWKAIRLGLPKRETS